MDKEKRCDEILKFCRFALNVLFNIDINLQISELMMTWFYNDQLLLHRK